MQTVPLYNAYKTARLAGWGSGNVRWGKPKPVATTQFPLRDPPAHPARCNRLCPTRK